MDIGGAAADDWHIGFERLGTGPSTAKPDAKQSLEKRARIA